MIIYFTKTGDVGFGITLHWTSDMRYHKNHPESPRIVANVDASEAIDLIHSAKEAGIHVCHCEES